MGKLILDSAGIKRAATRISYEIIEKNKGVEDICIIGIQRRGVSLAKLIKERIRENEGVDVDFGILDITENTVISNLSKYRLAGVFLSKQKMHKDTDWSIGAMRIKTPHRHTKIRALSGGNQQKVILGRWLLTEPEVLLLDEPTRGIDVGAKYEIYQLIIELAAKGKSVIMVSSEMPELLGICDRILVMSGGRLAGEVTLDGEDKQEEIMMLAAKYV